MAGFSECFLTGTAAEVTPVSQVGPYKFTPGRICEAMMEDYAKDVRGMVKQDSI
jgi:branched-chain amino acid aminotransferase